VEVLSVAVSESLLRQTPLAGMSDTASESQAARIVTSRELAEATAAEAVKSLRADGVHARWSIGQGNPAHEIIEAAGRCGSDLIVLGSRGHKGIARIIPGSVARNVLLHTDASVLIVREPRRARSAERVGRAKRQRFVGTVTAAM
jgi:nucleotide-binding universal stress UspA family protein